MKLVISKNRDGNGYYSKITNDYNGKHTEKYLTVQPPKDFDLDYGLYDVDGFLSTYEKKDGTVEFKLALTSATRILQDKKEVVTKDPYEEFGEKIKSKASEQLEITSDDLPF